MSLYRIRCKYFSSEVAVQTRLPCLALPCLALPCLALPCLAERISFFREKVNINSSFILN
ncbi:hypothetical protein B2O32_004889 [Salmonella enterica subsp. enterica serovar Berta]|nr:hypothetical protein [Salmonella enterica]EBC1521457.1 hypothetical protein [Salmonella enterica]ECS0832944.1 hypothetical protein [Salmonella enterica]EDU2029418.1 hypothetical protein [Salmonella enterica subsp. enterica serovar Pensacola]EDV8683490.1 hypothetical protein [Salmonella enterica subsp. enterica serovar Berta]